MSEGDWFWIGFIAAYLAVGVYVWALALREKWMFYKWRGLAVFILIWPLFLMDTTIDTRPPKQPGDK